MIEIRYLQAESGANRFGTCNCCGKSSGEDPLMISVKFSYYGHGTLICLCDDCKKKLMEVLPPANNSEIPNSSDTISRQAAIEALRMLRKDLRKLRPVEPQIIRCKECRHRDEFGCCKYWVGLTMGMPTAATDDDDFCSHAERKEVTE